MADKKKTKLTLMKVDPSKPDELDAMIDKALDQIFGKEDDESTDEEKKPVVRKSSRKKRKSKKD